MNSEVIGTASGELPKRPLRQDRTVTQVLALADAAAAQEEYVNALALLRTLDATRYHLDPGYASRRERWQLKIEAGRVGCSQWFG